MTFAYCMDCREFNYGIADKNGVFDRDKSASNHWDHRCCVFTLPPDRYIAPVGYVLAKLHAQLPISNIEMQFFKLAIDLAETDAEDNPKKLHTLLLKKVVS